MCNFFVLNDKNKTLKLIKVALNIIFFLFILFYLKIKTCPPQFFNTKNFLTLKAKLLMQAFSYKKN